MKLPVLPWLLIGVLAVAGSVYASASASASASAEADAVSKADPTAAPKAKPYTPYHLHPHHGYKPIYNPHYKPPKLEVLYYKEPELPKQNCTVQDEALRAEICVPDFQTKCDEDGGLSTRRLEMGEFCYDITRTVCTQTEITTEVEVCSYTYDRQEETAKAKTVEVEFEQKCDTQMVTVCQPAKPKYPTYPPYRPQHHGYGPPPPVHPTYAPLQQCNEVAQETCFNIPRVVEKEIDVAMGFPQARRSCENQTVTIPEIKCDDIVETKCQNIPRIVEGPDPVERCEVVVGPPKCSEVELVLPKQVCKDIVYGYADDQKPKHHPKPVYKGKPVVYEEPSAAYGPPPLPKVPAYKEPEAPSYKKPVTTIIKHQVGFIPHEAAYHDAKKV